ncbi:hypothetical protein [Streptomyces sp. NPDC048644]|uniref:hypothetical protein n=1 Tax=Streptomyces sp. NPDC048644 TaxID=3365582 RepID=UPI00371AEBA0
MRRDRPPAVDKHLYKQRNVVERCSNRLKRRRGITTRYDKAAESYQAAVPDVGVAFEDSP